jgi:hypothetical protein
MINEAFGFRDASEATRFFQFWKRVYKFGCHQEGMMQQLDLPVVLDQATRDELLKRAAYDNAAWAELMELERKEAVAAERERCAKVADKYRSEQVGWEIAQRIAREIREGE